jgi:hypothetical protein
MTCARRVSRGNPSPMPSLYRQTGPSLSLSAMVSSTEESPDIALRLIVTQSSILKRHANARVRHTQHTCPGGDRVQHSHEQYVHRIYREQVNSTHATQITTYVLTHALCESQKKQPPTHLSRIDCTGEWIPKPRPCTQVGLQQRAQAAGNTPA